MTSGKPTRAPRTATRKWQASANSKPPPRAVPCNAATTGFGIASIAAMTSCRLGACGGLPNSVMSAPAKKVRPAQATTTALTAPSSRAWLQGLGESGPHLVLQRVDWRVVDGDDGNLAVAAKIDAGVDAAH